MELNSPREHRHWHELAAEASTEQDDNRLIALVEQLCQALDREAQRRLNATGDCV